VDESTTIKNPNAKRTKNILLLGKHAQYRRILTGSPVTKSPLDLYSQCAFLDEDLLGHVSYYTFRNRYAVMVDRNFGGRRVQIVGSYQRLDELEEILKEFSYRVQKKDCLDLPKKIYQRYVINLTSDQEKIYKDLQKEYIAELEGKTVSAPEAITRFLRLQQITCNWFPTEDGIQMINSDNPRLSALMNILGEIQSKVIIWARFKADIRAIEQALGDSAVSYYGDISTDDRETAVDRFQNDPKIKYFIGQPQSGGIGLTLTAADYAIYYSNSFDLETRLQSEDRCHRIGTKKNVTYIDIETKGTIDSKIIEALRDKKNLADAITKDPRSMFLNNGE